MNLPQDVASFATSLPRRPRDLDVIIVRKEGVSDSYKDFKVRRSVVLEALQWLVANNIYYHNICIDASIVSELPEDGELSDIDLCTITLDSCLDAGSLLQDEVDPYNADLSSSFVPSVSQRPTEVEAVRHIVHNQGSNQQPQVTP